VQRLVENLDETGLSGSRVRGVVTALKVVLRRALEDDELVADPTLRLRLPMPAGTRDRVVTIDEGERLIRALPAEDRATWAVALYAGLRRGELRALQRRRSDRAEVGSGHPRGEHVGHLLAAPREHAELVVTLEQRPEVVHPLQLVGVVA
jgi:integrase